MATSIIRRRTQLAKTAALQKRMVKTMMRNEPRLFSAARPGALPIPDYRKLQEITPAPVLALKDVCSSDLTDIKTRYGAHAQALQWGWLSPNEVRALEDMNPRDDGDIYYPPPNTAGKDGGTSEKDEKDDDA